MNGKIQRYLQFSVNRETYDIACLDSEQVIACETHTPWNLFFVASILGSGMVGRPSGNLGSGFVFMLYIFGRHLPGRYSEHPGRTQRK